MKIQDSINKNEEKIRERINAKRDELPDILENDCIHNKQIKGKQTQNKNLKTLKK